MIRSDELTGAIRGAGTDRGTEHDGTRRRYGRLRLKEAHEEIAGSDRENGTWYWWDRPIVQDKLTGQDSGRHYLDPDPDDILETANRRDRPNIRSDSEKPRP